MNKLIIMIALFAVFVGGTSFASNKVKVLLWAQQNSPSVLTFSNIDGNLEKQLAEKRNLFTPRGYSSYLNFLKETQITRFLDTNDQYMKSSISMNSDADVTYIDEKIVSNMLRVRQNEKNSSWLTPDFIKSLKGAWVVNTPLDVGYFSRSKNRSQVDSMVLMLTIKENQNKQLKIDHLQMNKSYKPRKKSSTAP